jgi:hypothetical protein
MQHHDVAVVGAGAAGMFCAAAAAQRGARVVLIDHWPRLAEKVRISGGGRCNFTNLQADRPDRFVSRDPAFAATALRAYPPARFVEQLRRRGIGYHEKHRGQLFCDDGSERIVSLLREGCDEGGVRWLRPCAVGAVRRREATGAFELSTDAGEIGANALVVATGGLSIPKIGATDFGYRLARQFGLRIVEPRPALVPLTFAEAQWRPFSGLAGVALEVDIRAPADPAAPAFREDLLLTHRGLSGPAVLQISTFWRPGDPVEVDLGAGRDLGRELAAMKEGTRMQLGSALGELLPRRLAAAWLAAVQGPAAPEGARAGSAAATALRADMRLAEAGNRALVALGQALAHWRLVPDGTEGWRKAEVTVGGVDTAELDPSTMQARRVPGLYFVGEVVDVTGWLGGYNFQWAWASAYAAALALAAQAQGARA